MKKTRDGYFIFYIKIDLENIGRRECLKMVSFVVIDNKKDFKYFHNGCNKMNFSSVNLVK